MHALLAVGGRGLLRIACLAEMVLGGVLVWWQLARGLGRMVQGLGQRAAVVQLAIVVNLR